MTQQLNKNNNNKVEDLAKQRKKKVHRYGKKEIKLSLFTDNMIDHLYGKSEKKNLPRTEK